MNGIIITGLARSGKDTVAKMLHDFGYDIFVFSDCLFDELRKQNLELTKMNLSQVGDELRTERGMDVVAQLVFEKAKNTNAEKAVFVGARSLEEVEYLKKYLEKCVLVRVVAESDKRFDRKNSQDAQDRVEFFARDERDVKNKGLGKVIDSADEEIENNSDFEALKRDVEKLVDIFETVG
ncbi:MAG: AAA family ATPase [Candidatus Diapherotrites archaeon]